MSLECPPDASIESSGAARMRLMTKEDEIGDKTTAVQAAFASTTNASNSTSTPHKPTQSSGRSMTEINEAEHEMSKKLGLLPVVIFPIEYTPKTYIKTHMHAAAHTDAAGISDNRALARRSTGRLLPASKRVSASTLLLIHAAYALMRVLGGSDTRVQFTPH